MDRLGINPGFLLGQLVNFGIVVFILWQVWPRIVKTLEARAERIAKGLEDARNAEQALANAERNAQKLMDERRQEGNKLVDEARLNAEKAAQVVEAEARKEAEAIRAKARQEATEERDAILAGVRQQVASISIAAAQQVIGKSLVDDKNAHNVIADFLTKMPTGADSLGENLEVVSALPLNDDEKGKVQKATGAKNVNYKVDPSILGGLILRAGDRVIDGSVASKLKSLESKLS
jgi:F-type H+-transporting ATPase subunit b